MNKNKHHIKGQLNLLDELIVDNFAGGGGASTGIELALGRPVDIAINHDPDAIAMHRKNHPFTTHYQESVWDIKPQQITQGRPVALCWFSPDCKHFSKAKGGKPVEKSIRGLAWVAVRWAATVHPRVIILENVEEFKTWGPLTREGYPDPSQKGRTFNSFVNALKRYGYTVDWRELRACDYGAPTIRKRFFLVARRDSMPITWPEPTHGDPRSEAVRTGKLKPYRTAAEFIDWSLPCPSIFVTSEEIYKQYGIRAIRPLAEATMRRIARGIHKFVLNNPSPFIVDFKYNNTPESTDNPLRTITSVNGYGIVTPVITAIGQTGFSSDRSSDIKEPLRTIVSKAEQCLVTPILTIFQQNSNGQKLSDPIDTVMAVATRFGLIAPTLIQYHSETSNHEVRGQSVENPVLTVDASGRYALVSAFMAKHFGGNYTGAGSDINEPLHTITTDDHNALVTAFISRQFGTSTGHGVDEPLGTITATDKSRLVEAFLIKYYGQGTGQELSEPLDTVVSRDRFGLVTIHGQDYQIIDIGMRMLEPHELYAAQGFPEDYKIDFDVNGRRYSKSAQVARCGNSVPPPFAEALVRANLPELASKEKISTMAALIDRDAI
ncbi:MAG: DNA cytosine methyltransferase [Eubacteriales bacterium]